MSKTILILENDPEIRQILTNALKDAAYDVVCPIDSYVAIEYAQEHNVDLLILNDQMPIIDGKGTLSILQQLGIEIPTIVFLSQFQKNQNYDTYARSTCVQKPFKTAALVTEIASILNT